MDRREICHQFTVSYAHRVIFTDEVFAPANRVLLDVLQPPTEGAQARVAAFVDSGLAEHSDVLRQLDDYFRAHAGRIMLAADPLILSGGEAAKRDSRTFDRCVEALRDAAIDRHSYQLAIGGGALLDAAGFAASVVHRGVRQVRIPTTVLAQNDAGIGVKNGINYQGAKNFLGTFAPPAAVINDFGLLSGLTPQQWRDGTVEAVKVALLRDPAFFAWLEQNVAQLAKADSRAMRHLIYRCAQLHLEHIATAGDPFERGSARPLDFGHWAAHRLEQLSEFVLSHGQAVAVGIAIDAMYATQTGLLSRQVFERITALLVGLGFDLDANAPPAAEADCDRVLSGIESFREHLGGQLSITMLGDIGQPTELHWIDHSFMRQCVAAMAGPYLSRLERSS